MYNCLVILVSLTLNSSKTWLFNWNVLLHAETWTKVYERKLYSKAVHPLPESDNALWPRPTSRQCWELSLHCHTWYALGLWYLRFWSNPHNGINIERHGKNKNHCPSTCVWCLCDAGLFYSKTYWWVGWRGWEGDWWQSAEVGLALLPEFLLAVAQFPRVDS